MKFLLRTGKFLRLLFFAFMLAVCMVLGVAPVIPKRKEPFSIEVNMEETINDDINAFNLTKPGQKD